MLEGRSGMRRAEVLSTTGAVVLGAGLGLLFSRWLSAFASALFVAGACVHGYGMYARHRLDTSRNVLRARWEEPVYWLCWLLLAGLLAYAFLAPAGP